MATSPSTADGPAARPRARRTPLWWVAAVLTGLGMLFVLYLDVAAGLLAPLWAVAGLLVVWLLLLWLAVRVHRSRGAWSLLVPLCGFALWFAVLSLGENLLGWTA